MLGENIVVAIVGNKMDLEKNRKVTQAQAEEYVIAPCHTPLPDTYLACIICVVGQHCNMHTIMCSLSSW